MRALKPDMMVDTVFDLDLDLLMSKGINSLLIDLDNTLAPWNNAGVSKRLRRWMGMLKERGFSVCIVSNNNATRVTPFAKRLGVRHSIAKAGKPSRRSFMRAAELLNATVERCAVVGDQLFTDITGGNRAGMYTILVSPIMGDEHFGTTLLRYIEAIILKKYRVCPR